LPSSTSADADIVSGSFGSGSYQARSASPANGIQV
jgi:hypothetical protein